MTRPGAERASSRRWLLLAVLVVAVCGVGAATAGAGTDLRRDHALAVRSGTRTSSAARDAVVPRTEELRASRTRAFSLLAPVLGALCAVACRSRRSRRDSATGAQSSRGARAVQLRAPPDLLPVV